MVFDSDEDREDWLRSRGFEVVNTSHPLWHIKDLTSLDDLVYEFTLKYWNCSLSHYQVGYYGSALLYFKKWAIEHGFEYRTDRPEKILKVWIKYTLDEDNTFRSDDNLYGYFGSMKAAEDSITKNMDKFLYLKREFFTITEVDPYDESWVQRGIHA
jgi:hypothetical protein